MPSGVDRPIREQEAQALRPLGRQHHSVYLRANGAYSRRGGCETDEERPAFEERCKAEVEEKIDKESVAKHPSQDTCR